MSSHDSMPRKNSAGHLCRKPLAVERVVSWMPFSSFFDEQVDHLAAFWFDGWRVDFDSEGHPVRSMLTKMKKTNKSRLLTGHKLSCCFFINSPFAPVGAL